MYYSVSVDGKEISRVVNKDPRTFQNVRVFAGTKSAPAADASYRNLVWERGLSGSFQEDKLLSTVPEWGPVFSVSLDLKLSSLSVKDAWLIQFIEASKDSGPGCCDVGTRVPAIKLDKREGQNFEFSMGLGGKDFTHTKYPVKKGKWYRIVITQTLIDGKV